MEEKIAYEIHDGRVYIKVTTPTILGGSRTEGTQITLEELGSLFPYDEDPCDSGWQELPYPELFWDLFDPELNFPPAEKVVVFDSVRWPNIHPCRSYVLDHIFMVIGNGLTFLGGALFSAENLSWDKQEIARQNEAEFDATPQHFLRWDLFEETEEGKERANTAHLKYLAANRAVYAIAAETYPLPESHRLEREREAYEDLGDVVGPPYFSKTYSLLLNLPVTLREDWVAMAKENARYNLPKVEGEDRAQLEEVLKRLDELWPHVS